MRMQAVDYCQRSDLGILPCALRYGCPSPTTESYRLLCEELDNAEALEAGHVAEGDLSSAADEETMLQEPLDSATPRPMQPSSLTGVSVIRMAPPAPTPEQQPAAAQPAPLV